LPFIISTGRNEALHLQRSLSRTILEDLTGDLVARTVNITQQALSDAKLQVSEIDETILVGGMTRMPAVQRAVRQLFGKEPSKGVHPDEVVALGAAIQGAALVEERHEMVLLDVTPHDLGIMTVGSHFEELIPQNTTVPTSRAKIFTTSRDNQTAVKILVMQGESRKAEENEMLGEFVLTGLKAAPKGEVEIEVTFAINTDGIVSVSAKDMDTGMAQSIQVTATSGLTSDEIRNMMHNAQEYMVERRSDEAFETERQRAETLISEVESMFPVVERVVGASDFGRDALAKARSVVERARQAVQRKDTQAVREQVDMLERTIRMFRGVVSRGN
jgi:molecular chaperone DnaK